MGRNDVVSFFLLILFFVAHDSRAIAAAEEAPVKIKGNIGCLFSDSVCDEEYEWCFNDVAFGKCLPMYGKIGEQDLRRFKFGMRELKVLERQIHRLFLMGYRWSHKYTQCVLQSVLNSIKSSAHIDVGDCNTELDQDLEGALKAIEGEEMEQNITPDDGGNANSKFSDEVFYPSNVQQMQADHKQPSGGSVAVAQDGLILGHMGGKAAAGDSEKTASMVNDDPMQQFQLGDFGYKQPDYGVHDGRLKDKVIDEIVFPEDIIEEAPQFPFGQDTPYVYEQAGYEPMEVSAKDYDYDLLFHSPYATPPKLSRMFKRLQVKETQNGRARGDLPKIPLKNISLRELAFYLLDDNEKKEKLRNSLKNDDNNQNKRLLDDTNIGFFRKNQPHKPAGVPMDKPPVYGTPTNHYTGYFPREFQQEVPEIPELKPPEINENYRPADSIHPPYIGNNYNDKARSYDNNAISYQNKWDRSQYYPPQMDYYYDYSPYDYPYDGYVYDTGPDGMPWNPTQGQGERLDVKKPGPHFKSHNNYGFDYQNPAMAPVPAGGDNFLRQSHYGDPHYNGMGPKNKPGEVPQVVGLNENVPDLLLVDEEKLGHGRNNANRLKPMMKPAPGYHTNTASNQISKDKGTTASDDSIITIRIKGRFEHRSFADQMLHLLLDMIGLDIRKDINNVSLSKDGKEVSFHVKPNTNALTAEDVVQRAGKVRDRVKEKTGFEIVQIRVGHKSVNQQAFRYGRNQLLAAAAIVCGVCAALLAASFVLFYIRRHARWSRTKFGDLEIAKEYKDMCRSRFGKGSDANEPLIGAEHPTGRRVSSMTSKENLASNRTSMSWSEEPVQSNMDISTGHMVLSYMEDHLKNKDRLHQEWIALCAYEAEPCATLVAYKAENGRKNRCVDNGPYDHNRVILSEQMNAVGSNYVNASAITDHDPRNPTYIVTQGPLAGTVSDFWQMVWEQGSVVIVMLTKLNENGQTMCHRYWPEEGSDLYHIYEVHLVSEHIWCDDYLVRSFYLKNVRTNETRTVTQFHFLSWAQSGVPASTKPILEFRRKVNKSYRGRACPIIVHCSDGMGRSGTYILIDMVLNRLAKGTKEIDIAATLEHIRDQRPSMVKTKAQFEFVLMSVAEEVHAILKALPQ